MPSKVEQGATKRRLTVRLLHLFTDFLFPPNCVNCSQELSNGGQDARDSRLCVACHRCFTELAHNPTCVRCGAPIGPYVDSRNGCRECRRERFAFKAVYRLGLYEGELRTAILKGKYTGSESLLKSLAKLVWQVHGERLEAEKVDLVVPIPKYWFQRLKNWHHAPDVLAETWAGCLRVPVGLPILSKRKWTRKQAKLSRADRKRNQTDVFRVRYPARVQGKTVLLVDDVLTTGATAHSAARALKAAGAHQVIVAVIGRVIGMP